MIKKKRIPLIAALLSLVAPGLGQIYNNQIKKGIVFFLAYFLLPLLMFFTGLQYQFHGLIAILLFLICFWLFIIGDAFFVAVKTKEVILRPYNKWYIYLLIILLINSAYLIPTYFIANIANKVLGFSPYKIATGAMEPTLSIGDCLIADFKYFKKNDLQRGDLVIFQYPEDPAKDFIKRLIALEGEKIEIKNKQIYINDEAIPESYKVYNDSQVYTKNGYYGYNDVIRDNFGPIVVPSGYCFVMGDNRNNSWDSRHWGSLPLHNIKGKPLYIYWAKDKSRIGMKIK